jgi:hypothetical protein
LKNKIITILIILSLIIILIRQTSSTSTEIDKSDIILTTNITYSGGNNNPYNLTDGIFYSHGASVWFRGSAGYLKFDLNNTYYIDYMNIIYTSSTSDTFQIHISTDDINYTFLRSITLPAWGGQPSYDRDVKAIARYVKLIWGSVPSGYTAIMYEEITFYTINESVPPRIIDKTADIPTTGDQFTFNVTASDNLSVDQVFIEYWFDNNEHSNFTMARISGNRTIGDYLINITIPKSAFKLNYFITVRDVVGNWNCTISKVLDILDNDAPLIIDYTNSTPKTGEDFTINVAVTDNIEVSESYLEWWFDNRTPQNRTLLSKGAFYNTTIFIPTDVQILTYILSSFDINDNWVTLGRKILNISDIEKPMIIDFSDTPTTGDKYTFKFNITDNINLSRVYLEYWFDNYPHSNITLPIEQNHTINVPLVALTLNAIVTAIDTSNNIGNLKIIRTIIDNDAPVIKDLTSGKPETGSTYIIKCSIFENRKTRNVLVEYGFKDDDHTSALMVFEKDKYSFEITIPEDVIILNYSIVAKDKNNNIAQLNNTSLVLDVIPPELYDLTENTPSTGDIFEIIASAEDNIGIESINLEYWFDYNEHFNITINDSFQIQIPSNSKILNYILSVSDFSKNIREINKNVDVIDNDKPIINATQPKPTTGDIIDFNMEIYDNIEVLNFYFEYWFDDNEPKKIIGKKSFSILTPNNARKLSYSIYAEDGSKNTDTIEMMVDILDNDPPTIDDTSTKIKNIFNFNVYSEDNINVSEVWVEFNFDNGTNQNLTLELKDNLFNAYIPIPKDSKKINYRIYAIDTYGNWERTENIEVAFPKDESSQAKFISGLSLLVVVILIIIVILISSIFFYNRKKRSKNKSPSTEINTDKSKISPTPQRFSIEDTTQSTVIHKSHSPPATPPQPQSQPSTLEPAQPTLQVSPTQILPQQPQTQIKHFKCQFCNNIFSAESFGTPICIFHFPISNLQFPIT